MVTAGELEGQISLASFLHWSLVITAHMWGSFLLLGCHPQVKITLCYLVWFSIWCLKKSVFDCIDFTELYGWFGKKQFSQSVDM